MATSVDHLPPHGRVPRAVRKAQLLELAEGLFARRGYDDVSMDELARAAGITKPVVYGIFGSKEGLFRACVDAVAERLARCVTEAAAGADGDIEAQLRAGGVAYFTFVRELGRGWDALLAAGAGPFAAEAQAIRDRQATLVAGLIAAHAQGRGAEPSPLLVAGLAHALNGAYESLGRWALEHPDQTSQELSELVIDLVLPGLTTLSERSQP